MKHRMERISALPFSFGCVSQSSVAVGENQSKKEQAEQFPAPSGEDESQSSGKMKSSFMLLALPRPNISAGIQRLIKGFKSLSQLVVIYKEEDEDMEIGRPMNVQHVSHIGWDGFSNADTKKSWDRAPELLDIPSLSLRHFELVVAGHGDAPLAQAGHLGA